MDSPAITEAQRAAARPWIVGIFAAPIVGIAAFVVIGILLFRSDDPNLYLMATAIFGTSIAVRVAEWFCVRKLNGICPDDSPQTGRVLWRIGVEVLILGSLLVSIWWGLR